MKKIGYVPSDAFTRELFGGNPATVCLLNVVYLKNNSRWMILMRMILGGLLLSFLILANAADIISMDINTDQTEFQVILPSNPTTGYQWTVQKYDRFLLRLVTSQYVALQTNLMGAEGNMLFTFKLVSGKTYPSNTELFFKYARPWELENGILKTVIVNFQTVQ